MLIFNVTIKGLKQIEVFSTNIMAQTIQFTHTPAVLGSSSQINLTENRLRYVICILETVF